MRSGIKVSLFGMYTQLTISYLFNSLGWCDAINSLSRFCCIDTTNWKIHRSEKIRRLEVEKVILLAELNKFVHEKCAVNKIK